MAEKIKVIQMLPRLSVGGAERVVINIMEQLDPTGYEVELVCLKPATSPAAFLEAELRERGFKITTVGRSRFDIRGFIDLYRIFKSVKPNIIHTHLFSADIAGRVIGKLARVPHIISTLHNPNHSEGVIRRLIRKVTNYQVDALVSVSETVKNYLEEYERPSSKKMTVIFNGIEVEKYSGTVSSDKEVLTIGAVGRLTYQKGFDVLLEAVALLPQAVQVVIAGEGEAQPLLEEVIVKYNLQARVRLVGVQKDISHFLSTIDIFVLPSRWEGLPLVILEAGAAKLPVIVSDIPSIGEVITPDTTGLVFSGNNAVELKEQLERLIEDADLRVELGTNLQNIVYEKFSLRGMMQAYQTLYQDVCHRKPLRSLYENTAS